MTTIPEFILARVAEDEAVATTLTLRDPLACPVCGVEVETLVTPATTGARRDYCEPCNHALTAAQSAQCYEPQTPARVLAQCKAYRAIVEIATDQHTGGIEHDDTLRALASIWADHSEFKEEWSA